MNEKCKVTVNAVFRSKNNSNNKINISIESKNVTDIDEIFDQLIKKHEDLTKSLIDFVPEGVYNLTEIITMNTFIKTPEWLTLKMMFIKSTKQ